MSSCLFRVDHLTGQLRIVLGPPLTPIALYRHCNSGANRRLRCIELEDVFVSDQIARSPSPALLRFSKSTSGFGVGGAMRRRVLVSRWSNGGVTPLTAKSVRVT